MGKFFANQKLDAAGVVGITLQKLLIFFMVLDALMFIFGYAWFSSLMSLLFHFAVFMGVYRRRTCILLLYVVFNVVMFILAAVAVVLMVASFAYITSSPSGHHKWVANNGNSTINGNSTYTNYPASDVYHFLRTLNLGERQPDSPPPAPGQPDSPHPAPPGHADSPPPAPGQGHPPASGTEPSPRPKPSSKPKPSPRPKPSKVPPTHQQADDSVEAGSFDESDDVEQVSFVVAMFALVASILVLYFKILSVVLAHRMRKLLLAPVLPVTSPTEKPAEKTQTVPTPTYVPVDMEGDAPLFAPQGFVYQPMVPQANLYPGQAAMMSAPFMYGQQPVYYSYAPVPTNEKQ